MNYFENKTIVVPHDFSKLSAEALDQAIEMSEESTNIFVLHVVEPTPVISVDTTIPMPPSFDHDRHQHAIETLKQKFQTPPYMRVKTKCLIGDPGETIAQFSREVDADLIIMPSHGRKGISRLLLGSVAERVLRIASCPVLIIRQPTQA